MRSLLFVPGDRPERFDKACASGADAVILDLEDAVAPEAKTAAREAVRAWLARRPSPAVGSGCALLVRTNAAHTPWFAADLELVRRPGLDGIVLPKAERVDAVEAMASAGPVLPLIESALGMHRVDALAAVHGVQRLVFGTVDFRLDLGLGPGRADADQPDDEPELLAFRSRLVLASRVAGLAPPVDGVCTALDDAARLARESRRGRTLGFGAKLCIHPAQVPAVNAAFMPTTDEIAWAERVLAAVRGPDGGAVQLDGRMVDRPVVLQAERVRKAAGGD